MTNKKDYSQDFVKLLLPREIFDYFEITNLLVEDNSINVYLDELNIIPDEYSNEKLISKGFHPISIVQDFPIRKKPVFLHIKRRRWLIKSNNKIVSRNWETVAKGTRYTKSFAAFLKGLLGYLPDKL